MRSSPEQCMPKSASPDSNFRGESFTMHAFGTACKGCVLSNRIPPSAAERRACRWAAGNVRRMADMRESLAHRMQHKRLRPSGCGAQRNQSSSIKPRMHADYARHLGSFMCTGSTHSMCRDSPACAASSVLRNAPGASSPQSVGARLFAAGVRTLRRQQLAGEARPAAVFDGARAGSGAHGVREALERPARKVILFRTNGAHAYANGCTHRVPSSSERRLPILLACPP
jgi:hypothetical protein